MENTTFKQSLEEGDSGLHKATEVLEHLPGQHVSNTLHLHHLDGLLQWCFLEQVFTPK